MRQIAHGFERHGQYSSVFREREKGYPEKEPEKEKKDMSIFLSYLESNTSKLQSRI